MKIPGFLPYLLLELVVCNLLEGLELDLSVLDSRGEGILATSAGSEGRSEGLCDLAPKSGLHVASGADGICRPLVDDAEE